MKLPTREILLFCVCVHCMGFITVKCTVKVHTPPSPRCKWVPARLYLVLETKKDGWGAGCCYREVAHWGIPKLLNEPAPQVTPFVLLMFWFIGLNPRWCLLLRIQASDFIVTSWLFVGIQVRSEMAALGATWYSHLFSIFTEIEGKALSISFSWRRLEKA